MSHAEPITGETECAVSTLAADATFRTWLGFLLMCLGMFMAILDIQVVATSLPAIQEALGISRDAMSWVQTAYLIAEIIAIPLTGWLTRTLTLRWMFVAAVGIFTTASIGCALSDSFSMLISFRIVQGFAGGALIPAVFSAVFLLFPLRLHPLATTLAGIVAVLAPTVGPIVGGWITETWSWHWLFLINVVPGVLAAAATPFLLPRDNVNFAEFKNLDRLSLVLLAVTLTTLEIGLKQAPQDGWLSPRPLALFATSLTSGWIFVKRSIKATHPVVELKTLRAPAFAVGCALSFCLGVGLYGSVYLMPVFLGFVRGHDALRIGEIMLLSGLAQLITAPIAVALERRADARLVAAAGFALFAAGLAMSTRQTGDTDFQDMIWPQIMRGAAIMLCLLAPTRMALGRLPLAEVADASGLFNLMRNLGGAIGIALIDTVIYGRSPVLARAIVRRLEAGDVPTAKAVGLPLDLFLMQGPGPVDPATAAYLKPMVERLALVRAINEAWLMLAVLTALVLVSIPFARRPPSEADGSSAPPIDLEGLAAT